MRDSVASECRGGPLRSLVKRLATSPSLAILLASFIASVTPLSVAGVSIANTDYEEISEDVSDLCEAVELGDGTYYLVAAYRGNAVALTSRRSGSKQPYVRCKPVKEPIYRSFGGKFVVQSTCGLSTVRFYFKDQHGAADFAVLWGGVTTV
ncbi:hypothetical protein FOZ63_019287, partial [Perkinsus olseni]